MQILMVSAESAPFLRTSDVASVVSELCVGLNNLGHDVRLALPFQRELAHMEDARLLIPCFDVRLGTYARPAEVWRLDHPFRAKLHVPVYLIRNEFYFGRENPYGYMDDYERFTFFSRAVLEMLQTETWARLEGSWCPQVIHCHDWATGLIPFWLVSAFASDGLPPIASAYTLHNAGFPGQFERRALHVAGIEGQGIYEQLGETADMVNFMARGVWAADAVNTVSPTHAREMWEGSYPSSLTPALRQRKECIAGILNGIDQASYDPAFDTCIAARFNVHHLEVRPKNKLALQEQCRLAKDEEVPLIGMVSRLIAEKGLGIVGEALNELLSQEEQVQVVILGARGDHLYHEALAKLARRFAGRMHLQIGFDDCRARQIFAACDVFLVPSLNEPCGLQQMIAMNYGAIPLVRRTGGLADTVSPYEEGGLQGWGFVFDDFDARSLLGMIRDALQLYRSQRWRWQDIQRHNMGVDFSWGKQLQRYIELYEYAVEARTARKELPRGQVVEPDHRLMLVHALLQVNDLSTAATGKYLDQVADLIRELLCCDGVLIWEVEPGSPHRLRQSGKSFSGEQEPEGMVLPEWVEADLGVRSWGPQYIYRRVPGAGGLSGQMGFLESKVAAAQGWQVQHSVPMSTQGTVLGRIDVFFCDQDRSISELDRASLSALSGVLAASLERRAELRLADQLLQAGRAMSAATTVRDVARVMLKSVVWLLHTSGAALHMPDRVSYLLAEDEKFICQTSEVGDGTEPVEQLPSRETVALELDGPGNAAVLQIWRDLPGGFTHRDRRTLQRFVTQAAAILMVAHRREAEELLHSENLRSLLDKLAGFTDLDGLLQSVLETTARVLDAKAASLYMVMGANEYLEIKAADGHHRPLMEARPKPCFRQGDGIVAWVWETGEVLRRNTLEEQRAHSAWNEYYNHLQGLQETRCFLGVPLTVRDQSEGTKRVIGVLILADRPACRGENQVFSQEDQHRAEMMAFVIARMVHSTHLAEERLEGLSTKLGSLSGALVGSQDFRSLMDSIVTRIREVLGVDAASLFLADEKREKLIIEAADGYQRPLMKVDPRPFYLWGEGVTGRVAQENKPFAAETLSELRSRGGNKKGKYDHLQGDKQPESFYGMPLNVRGEVKPIGVLKVESLNPRRFSTTDILLIRMMGNVIAAVVYNAKESKEKLDKLNKSVQRLSDALAGGQDRRKLLDSIVMRIREVLGVDAASLFLADEKREKLIIEAADGYQRPLMEADPKPAYRWGEGVTGRVAQQNEPFYAETLSELRTRGGNKKGKYDHLQGDKQPESFYGIPLRVGGEVKPIGVLKVESLTPRRFPEEEQHLVQMMGNVIAAVIYNAQISDNRLTSLSNNLKHFSNVLTPGQQNTQQWFQTIVKTLSDLFQTDAASLYLLDEGSRRLVIAAASGYQEPLIRARVSYESGEGVTGRILETGKSIQADTLAELRQQGAGDDGPALRGKYDSLQGGNQPNSFYGVPLKATDADKPIGVLKFESLREKFFNDETRLLIDMMAKVIATVIHNTQQGERRLRDIFSKMGTLSGPRDASAEVLLEYARQEDAGLVNQLACTLAGELGREPDRIEEEARALFLARSGLGPELRPHIFERVSHWARSQHHERVEWQFALYESVLRRHDEFTDWPQVQDIAEPWIQLRESTRNKNAFQEAAHRLVEDIARAVGVKVSGAGMEDTGTWYKANLGTKHIFGDQLSDLLVVLQRQGQVDERKGQLLQLATAGTRYPAVLVVNWSTDLSREQVKEARRHLKAGEVDIVFARIEDLLRVMQAESPADALRSLVLRQVRIVSPFIIEGAVPETRFFGREQEVRELTHHPAERDYAVIGNRRIGKTSLLHRIFTILSSHDKIQPLKVNCQAVVTRGDFFNQFQVETGLKLAEPTPGDFAEAMRHLANQARTPVLMIDEIDNLLASEAETGEPLVNVWRSLSQERICRFQFFGSRELARKVTDPHSMMCSFPQPLYLGYLTPEAAELVLTEPLQKTAVDIESREAVVKEVLSLTSCHPRLVQWVGAELIGAVNRRDEQEERRIRLSEVEEIAAGDAFRQQYLNISWGVLGPMERLVTLLAPGLQFSIEQLEREFEKRGIPVLVTGEDPPPVSAARPHAVVGYGALREALFMLQSFSVLQERRQVYHLIPEALIGLVQGLPSRDRSEYVNTALRELMTASSPKEKS